MRLNDGSTGVMVLLRGKTLITANVGDSRAILISNRKAIPLSEDHKPTLASEQKRIASFGGTITYNTGIARVAGVLAVSRAFGNYGIRNLIRADPDIIQRDLTSDDHFIVIASDGLWDVFRNNEVADMCYNLEKHGVQRIADHLVQSSLSRGSMDNVTCVVIQLSKYYTRMNQLETEKKSRYSSEELLSMTLGTAVGGNTSNLAEVGNGASLSKTMPASLFKSVDTTASGGGGAGGGGLFANKSNARGNKSQQYDQEEDLDMYDEQANIHYDKNTLGLFHDSGTQRNVQQSNAVSSSNHLKGRMKSNTSNLEGEDDDRTRSIRPRTASQFPFAEANTMSSHTPYEKNAVLKGSAITGYAVEKNLSQSIAVQGTTAMSHVESLHSPLKRPGSASTDTLAKINGVKPIVRYNERQNINTSGTSSSHVAFDPGNEISADIDMLGEDTLTRSYSPIITEHKTRPLGTVQDRRGHRNSNGGVVGLLQRSDSLKKSFSHG
jgi:hypothetical protein